MTPFATAALFRVEVLTPAGQTVWSGLAALGPVGMEIKVQQRMTAGDYFLRIYSVAERKAAGDTDFASEVESSPPNSILDRYIYNGYICIVMNRLCPDRMRSRVCHMG